LPPTNPPQAKSFASIAQREKWKTLLQEGKVNQDQWDARESATNVKMLPPRATPRARTVGASRSFDAAKPGHERY
jgi:hypothetical protein